MEGFDLTVYKIGKKEYYLSKDLHVPLYAFYEGHLTDNAIIKKLDDGNYIYAREGDDGKWKISDGKSKKYDQLFIDADYCNENYEELSEGLRLAPEILKLTKKEKFKDADGNVVEIEVRGTRDPYGCYFSVADIAEGFGMKRIRDVILNPAKKGFSNEKHYVYFIVHEKTDNIVVSIKKRTFPYLYGLT